MHDYSFHLVKINPYGYHPFTTFFHKGKKYNALIDSGASCSFLNINFFEKYTNNMDSLSSISMGNDFSTWIKEFDQIDFLDVIMNKLTLFKFDASSLNKSLEAIGFSSIDGILGSDLINLAHIKIDFESVQLITEKENVIKALSINDKNDECPFFVISAMFNHQPLKLLVDTGASQSLLDIRTAERLFGADSVNWSINTDSSFGISPSDILNIKQQFPISFEDGDFAWDICFTAFKMNKLNQTYRTANIPPVDAILGFDFLKKHCKEMDFRKHTICLQ